jgi:hypothetical protein
MPSILSEIRQPRKFSLAISSRFAARPNATSIYVQSTATMLESVLGEVALAWLLGEHDWFPTGLQRR